MFFAELNVKFLFYPDVKSEKKQTNINSLSIPSTSLGGVILSRKVGKKKTQQFNSRHASDLLAVTRD